MKKLLIFTLGAMLLLGGILLTNAKENLSSLISGKQSLNRDNLKQEARIVDIMSGLNIDVMTGSNNYTGSNHNSANAGICDLNGDGEISVADINRFNTHCSITKGRDSNKCDLNGDGEINISDVNVFNYTCYNSILGTDENNNESNDEGEMCDFDNNGKVDIADITRYIGECINGNGRDSKKCDLNGNGKFDVDDITTLTDVCYNKILGNEPNKPDNKEPEDEGQTCDFNNDKEINIADVNRFNTYCSVTNGQNPTKCDLNNDGEFSVADINVFNYTCMNEIMGTNSNNQEVVEEGKLCDFNNDKEINIADVNRFNTHCSVTNGRDSNKCDLNGDREFNISDINVFNYTCMNEIMGTNSTNGSNNNGKNGTSIYDAGLTTEQQKAYQFAYENGITTVSIENSKMNSKIKRIELAKMVSNYAINVLGKEPELSKNCKFSDVPTALDKKYDGGVTTACQLGLMGQGIKNFNPEKGVTRAEFGTVLSRLLWGDINEGGKTYYENHLNALLKEGIITTNVPNKDETRGNVMIMLMRAEGK